MHAPATVLRVTLPAVCALLALGCDAKPSISHSTQQPAPTTAVAPTTPPAPMQPSAKPTPEPAPAITEADARALVDRWAAAQNGGDFAAYQALYADRFEGIKRVGTRTSRFERKGWLRDRERMFAAPMKVEVTQLELVVRPQHAIASFEQTWSSKAFRDQGPKQLLLVMQGGALRITREELFESRVAIPPEQEWSLREYLQIVHSRHHYVVLAHDAEAWAVGPPHLDHVDDDSADSVRRDANLAQLPQPAREMLGQPVVAYGAAGAVCRAKVGKPFVWRRAIRQWMGDERPSSEQQAQELWDEASERTLLVAELSDPDADCKAALWAHAADRPAPVIFIQEALAPELAPRVERQVRSSAPYLATEREYRKYVAELYPDGTDGPAQRWENFDETAPTLRAWRAAERTLVSYEVTVGGCAEFGASLWALFELRGDQLVRLAQRGSGSVPDEFGFVTLVDVDVDGLPDAMGGGWLNQRGEADQATRGTRKGLLLLRDVTPALHGCGC